MESPIKTARNKLCITQGDLAMLSGIPQARISGYECAIVKLTEKAYRRIADSMGIDVEILKINNESFIKIKRKEVEIRVQSIKDRIQLIKNQKDQS